MGSSPYQGKSQAGTIKKRFFHRREEEHNSSNVPSSPQFNKEYVLGKAEDLASRIATVNGRPPDL
jgi:hypothetical protein